MAGPIDQRPSQAGATPVPDLIERYRSRRDAWIAQADELARLRDEVRGSAEREAMEIVTAARRDVRRIVTEARRELLVLSAQVQAALGEATAKADPATLLQKAGITTGDQARRPSLTEVPSETGFAGENGVDDILNEMHADVTALAQDARALPLQAAQSPRSGNGSSQPAAARLPAMSQTVAAAPVTIQMAAQRVPAPDVAALSHAASRALLSSPFPSDAVPIAAGRRVRTFVGLFVAIGMLVALGTIWWMRAPGASDAPAAITAEAPASQPSSAPPAPEPVSAPTVEPPPPQLSLRNAAATRRGNLSVVVESVREVWMRTTIDGRPDLGRTLTAGQVVNIAADQSISLRVGDAGAMVVSVNGGEKRPLGRDGQVVTRQFVFEGASNPVTPLAPVVPPLRAIERAPTSAPATTDQPLLRPAEPIPPSRAAPSPLPAVSGSAPATPTNIGTAPPPRPAPSTAADSFSAAGAVVAAARQWLDAYQRQDRAALAALSAENMTLADERRPEERLPPGLQDVRRTLDNPSVQVEAGTAVLTAVMTEQSDSLPAPRVSPVSQVWVLTAGGQWKVRQARFVSEARLNQVFR